MGRFSVSAAVIMTFCLFAATALAQSGPEDLANQRRTDAELLLNELNDMGFENQNAIDTLEQANNAYNSGMTAFLEGNWQEATDRFEEAIQLGGDAEAIEMAGDIVDQEIDLDLPWGDSIDLEEIGQGVRSSDFPILLGLIFVSIFIILPVTYRLV